MTEQTTTEQTTTEQTTTEQTTTGIAAGVIDRLGVRLHPTGAGSDPRVLLGLALRRNPRRAQLLVSRVLGKHVPTDPRLVRSAGLLLGGLVADALADRPARTLPVPLLHAAVEGDRTAVAALHTAAQAAIGEPPDALVLGFAETATALGHCVAEGLGGADVLHSTRRPVPGFATAGGFTEEHSHATEHLLLPADPGLLRGGRPLVLVDDELSTGRTVLNTITALHRASPRERYVVAALVDVRPAGGELPAGVAALGARLDVVSLARGVVDLPPDVAERATALRAELEAVLACTHTATREHPDRDSRVELAGLGWPAGVPAGARHGFGAAEHRAFAAALPRLADALAPAAGMRLGERTLVLGTEELMQLPLRLAQTLADAGHNVAFSTTTRSPAVVVDEPGYALTSGITFPAHDGPADGPGPRFAYNIGAADWDHVLVVVDPPADTPALHGGLLPALAPYTRRTTLVVTP
ncbi:phosphoribosyltransferase-like predicted ribonucleoside biosynthesis protein [Pseudonocardia hierapolitana]|uniref:Phosphoribosyltransferase-like predicted ribonucleoside biosynthesis protein n=1 Tax=Pseudonocardia hierapolitana TaxID=1128676 RepID=A0A561T1D0_9PSEU|nr:phosphoribosyltransferase family protein [Pseudonocardia hierapolitana]TWF80910.1 phosphoribosyltransferase-like predicted ribonucleoside biosynthesis protein [Pseudonocardia hierapolitana]